MTEAKMKKIQRTDPEAQSADVVAENVARLRELFPELITEGEAGVSVNVDVLKQLVGDKTVTDADEKYGLNWHGKRAARQLALTPSLGTLRPCPEDSVDWDTTQNLMIEGDNLEVLKLLQKSYAGKVKLIYIDPPYNTGNDFVYPDNFQDNIRNYLELTGQVEGGAKISSNTEASGRFHTDWLNMLLPRMRVASQLLSPDGAIAVSIDEHECPNARRVLDEVFGEENFIGEVAVSLNPKGRQLAPYFATSHEYVIFYAKSIDLCVISPSSSEAVNASDFPLQDASGHYRLLPLRNTNKKFNKATRPNLHYPLYIDPKTGLVHAVGRAGLLEVFPVFGDGADAVWRWSRPKVERQFSELLGREVSGRMGPRWDVFQKDYLTVGRTKKLKSLWLAEDVGSTDVAMEECKSLIGSTFQTAKPTALIRRISQLMPSDAFVLDFFAGSGTTGHATMAQNALDGGSRRFAQVQLPEVLDPDNPNQEGAAAFCDKLKKPRNIAELTKERLRRAGKQVKKDNPKWKGDTGFRVFKLDSSNIKAWDPATDNLEKDLTEQIDHLKADRSEQDILYEMLLKLGLDLCVPMKTEDIAGKQVHSIGGGVLMACLDQKIERKEAEKLALGIAEWHKQLNPAGDTTCVFRDSAFADDVAKTNLAAILNQQGITTVRSI